uniref:DNA-directed RNA polymerase RpoA/D/Rpb3-type domain-containing protein n=1 Tax=Oryza punctata TaxID=4537 RepID=A0A0E0K4N1_ORYPU
MGSKSSKDTDDEPKQQEKKLPEHLEVQRTRVVCNADAPVNRVSGEICKNFEVEINRLTEEDMEFDMIGSDASIANAFRRILIAEILGILYISQKMMSQMKETLLCTNSMFHVKRVPHGLQHKPVFCFLEGWLISSIVSSFHIVFYCTVKSGDLEWLPEGSQLPLASPAQSGDKQKTYTSFSQSQKDILEKPLGVKFKDITIARLGPGQAIELEVHAVKGMGKVHAKWSPVATAWYRMLPEVVFRKEIKGDNAEKLVKKCPVNVFDIEDLGNGEKRAVVARPRACTLCRECVMGPTGEQVELRRVRDHFIFTIESTGALPPEALFTEAVRILEEKCRRVISELS